MTPIVFFSVVLVLAVISALVIVRSVRRKGEQMPAGATPTAQPAGDWLSRDPSVKLAVLVLVVGVVLSGGYLFFGLSEFFGPGLSYTKSVSNVVINQEEEGIRGEANHLTALSQTWNDNNHRFSDSNQWMEDNHPFATSRTWWPWSPNPDHYVTWSRDNHNAATTQNWNNQNHDYTWSRDNHNIAISQNWNNQNHDYTWTRDNHDTATSQYWRDNVEHRYRWTRDNHHSATSRNWEIQGHTFVWSRDNHDTATSENWSNDYHFYNWTRDNHNTATSQNWYNQGHSYSSSRGSLAGGCQPGQNFSYDGKPLRPGEQRMIAPECL